MNKDIVKKKWLTNITINLIQDKNDIKLLIPSLFKIKEIAGKCFEEMNMNPIEEFNFQDIINFRFGIESKNDISKMFKFATSLNAKLNHSNNDDISFLISVLTRREDVMERESRILVIDDILWDSLNAVRDISKTKDRNFNVIINDIFKINLEGHEKNIVDSHSFPLGIKLKNSNEKFWGNDIYLKKDILS